MNRGLLVLAIALGSFAAASATAQTLVLPLRTIGVSDTTASVVGDLLQGELEKHGTTIVPASRLAADFPRDASACDDVACAAEAASRYGASRVVYGSLSRLGDKIIFRAHALRTGDTAPYYADQIAATTEDDLDTVVRRVANNIVLGRPNADRATIENVTAQETLEPRRRAARSAIGLRAGFLFPVNNSYGGNDHLTNLRLAIKYETRDYLIETTPVLGFTWGGGTLEWTALDVFGARVLSRGDVAPYIGAGLGVHGVRVEKRTRVYSGYGFYETGPSQSETTLTADVGLGALMLRTYDFQIVLDLRYHYVFADFDQLGGRGAHGIALTFGTTR